MPRERYDVVVVGSGGAGLRAAIAAADAGARVLVVTKGSLQHSGATASANFSYCAGFGYFGPDDTAAAYAEDIVASGLGFADPPLARRLAEGAGREADALEDYGVAWRRQEDGRHQLATFGGHRFPRAIHVGLRTGKVVMAALARAAAARGVATWEHALAVELLGDASGVCGVLVHDVASGELATVAAGAVVIATGGCVAMFALHTNPDELTGDGMALAYEAGAELVDMEFIQHYPTVFLAPAAARGLHYPTGRLLGFGGRLLNARGEEFFGRYEAGPIERATRDQVARAIALEVRAGGGTPGGGVWVDASAIPPERVRDVHFEAYFHDIGVCVEREPQEVTAAAHYALGGIRIDRDGRTGVPGLFAAGEVAGGVHGANRLTGSALPEVIVFGAAAGRAAAARAAATPPRPLPESRAARWVAGLRAPGGDAAISVAGETARLRAALAAGAGTLKSAEGLEAALATIADVEARLPALRARAAARRWNWEIVQCLELRAMLVAARLHCLAALERTESRGAHQRLDRPRRDDARWCRRIVLRRSEDGPRVEIAA
ncbi:MAG: FAD-binding protein [Alphaproteobacteria bacterium]|nr:FAD-binding protein [Alphaproteobacteria bacterium]